MMEQMEKFKKYREKLKLLKSKTDVEIVGPVKTSFATDDFMIGQGSFGTTVFLGLDDNDNPVAVKRILTQTAACLVKVEKEAKLLDLLQLNRSKHIVSYRHFESGNPFSYLILDLCEEDLADFVMSNSKDYLQRQGPVIIKEILTGLRALHSGAKKILHMDLKPENILVDCDGHMRLADFGLSRILDRDQTSLQTGSKGTPGWMAAESLPKQGEKPRFKRKSDIQVVGMISFYVLTQGLHPFGDVNHRTANIHDGKPVDLKEYLNNSAAREFISWLIQHDPKDRPYVEDALEHPYVKWNPELKRVQENDRLAELNRSDVSEADPRTPRNQNDKTIWEPKTDEIKTVIGSRIPGRTILDRLRLQFKNEKRPGGGGITSSKRKSAPARFRDSEVPSQVLQKTNIVRPSIMLYSHKTEENVLLKVYLADITSHTCDVMVNFVNGDLQLIGRLASMILAKGGQEIQHDCDKRRKSNGPLKPGECFVGVPGKLPFKCIIHTSRPRWHSGDQDRQKKELELACENIFKSARDRKTIAFTAVGWSVDAYLCANVMGEAALKFSATTSSKHALQEIHFVDKDQVTAAAFVNEIMKMFKLKATYDETYIQPEAK